MCETVETLNCRVNKLLILTRSQHVYYPMAIVMASHYKYVKSTGFLFSRKNVFDLIFTINELLFANDYKGMKCENLSMFIGEK